MRTLSPTAFLEPSLLTLLVGFDDNDDDGDDDDDVGHDLDDNNAVTVLPHSWNPLPKPLLFSCCCWVSSTVPSPLCRTRSFLFPLFFCFIELAPLAIAIPQWSLTSHAVMHFCSSVTVYNGSQFHDFVAQPPGCLLAFNFYGPFLRV